VDQHPDNDLSRQRSQEFGVPQHSTIAAALRCGGRSLAVDGVLIIGEHGRYPRSPIGQTQYPRYEFLRDVVDVFREEGRSVPVFNDKHLSWKWEWAEEMIRWSRELRFPFMAGSSLPWTWRMPAIDMPWGADVREAMCVAIGGPDSYDFHALETLQCMVERRRAGETGVEWVEALRGPQVWTAMETGSFAKGGWDPALFKACLSRSHTLVPARTGYSHHYPTDEEICRLVKDPIAYRIRYRDGLCATMLLMNGLVDDFTFAARLDRSAPILSTLFYLPPNPNVHYSAILMSRAEELFVHREAPAPIERTLLTTGLVAAGVQSLAKGGERLQTPHLGVQYHVRRESLFCRT
jgi:hypothetical protein